MNDPTIKYFDKTQHLVTHLIENNINNNSNLRSKPTQLNYFVDTNYSSLGGLPFLGKGYSTANYADAESKLKFFSLQQHIEDRSTEIQTQRNLIISEPTPDMHQRITPSSTRSDYRNMLNNYN